MDLDALPPCSSHVPVNDDPPSIHEQTGQFQVSKTYRFSSFSKRQLPTDTNKSSTKIPTYSIIATKITKIIKKKERNRVNGKIARIKKRKIRPN